MIKDLWITDITNEERLREVLDILGDDTWNKNNINNMFMNKFSEIIYSEENEEYFKASSLFLTKLTYQEFMNKYSNKKQNKGGNMKLTKKDKLKTKQNKLEQKIQELEAELLWKELKLKKVKEKLNKIKER